MNSKILNEIGYDSTENFIDSLIHPKSIALTGSASAIASGLAYYFEQYFGIAPIVGVVIFILFIVEMFTGIKASKKEGKGFSSKKFGSGILKKGIYVLIIGIVHVLSQNIHPKPLFGWEFNIYEWLHYFFLNYVTLQMIISNIENSKRLGWDDMMPAINKISKFIGIEDKKSKNDKANN